MKADNLFDFLTIIFEKQNEYKNVGNNLKQRHFFMLNRLMSIQYPQFANVLNYNGISTLYGTEMWARFGRNFKKRPAFLFTKTNKSSDKTKKVKLDIDQEHLQKYMELKSLSKREIDELIEFNGKAFEKFIKEAYSTSITKK